MSDYIKHTWEDGDIVDAPKMNNIETGIVEARQAAEKVGLQLSKLVNSDEDTLAELQKLVNYINENKDLIDEISASKVNITDIVNNLVTNATDKPLSAAQGVVLKSLIDALQKAVENAATAAKSAQDTADDAQANLTAHNTGKESHADIRIELKALSDRIGAVLDSDDETLDELSEIVAYIKSNKTLLDAITTSKVNVSDIVDNLVTNVANKPLSAAQGVVLKNLIDALQSAVNGKAPTSHAASTPTYGEGSNSKYGHVKLSDSIDSTSGSSGGMAATPAAVKAAYDLAKGKAEAKHNQAASTITAGTFGGQVVANASDQSPSVSLLRNSKIVLTEEDPTVEGEIVWVCK